jgi:alanyl-tRNA synthetase
MDETLVTFASGATKGRGRVTAVAESSEGARVVVVDETPFHPVDHTWPDQPGDHGTLDERAVVDTLMAASSPTGELLLGSSIPVRRGEAGWTWLVAHRLADGAAAPSVGADVELVVAEQRRRGLSAAHTACHLAALAMNRATAPLWRKEARQDSLGAPDLDQIAMVSSVMDETGSTDTYRLGKSLRKKGFDTGSLGAELEVINRQVNDQLGQWIAAGAEVSIDDGGDRRLSGVRRWTCALPEGQAALPCGGTHLSNLDELSTIEVAYQLSDVGAGLTVRTTPSLRAAGA